MVTHNVKWWQRNLLQLQTKTITIWPQTKNHDKTMKSVNWPQNHINMSIHIMTIEHKKYVNTTKIMTTEKLWLHDKRPQTLWQYDYRT